LLLTYRDGALAATGPSVRLLPDGAVSGPVLPSDADGLVRRLRDGDDPGPSAPDLPWAAAAVRDGGVLAVTASTLLQSGVFWSVEPDSGGWRVVAGTEPLPVARARRRRGGLDPDFLRGFLLCRHAPTRTPYAGVHRLLPGDTLTFDPRTGRTAQVEWCGPGTLPPPRRHGPALLAEYRETFDGVVRGLAAVAGELVVGVSGGLDSTFLTASLAAGAPGRPVHGYCYRPLPAAGARPTAGFDPDDYPLAVLMAQRYPTVTVEPLTNDGRRHPLDVAEETFRRSGWPEYACTNTVWLGQLADHAHRLDARLYFLGMHGNATFSNAHRYADPRHRLVPPAARSLLRAVRGRPGSPFAAVGLLGAGAPVPDDHAGRSAYLHWASTRSRSLLAAANPARTPGVLGVDPYTARPVIELAASIRPAEWRRGPQPRALARRLAEGRVPDPIRLRTRRGGQSGDVWFVVRQDLPRLAMEIDVLLGDDRLAAVVDPDGVRAWLARARETEARAPAPATLPLMLRLLAARRFADWAAAEVATP
jgi:hypothetical protein